MSQFNESNSDFYDLEYYISLEYRYLSGAHNSRIRNVLSAIGEVKGRRCLDVGCGGGFFANELLKKGAIVTGIDYSRFAIQFAKDRFSKIDFRMASGYNLNEFGNGSFDVVTLLDVIEHMVDQKKLLSEINRILKPEGILVISTDVDDGPWSKGIMPSFVNKTLYFSKDGRAYRLIKKVESYRRQFKDYHASHVAALGAKDIKKILSDSGFSTVSYRIYPLVGVPIRDLLLRFLPMKYRGNHQCIVAKKIN